MSLTSKQEAFAQAVASGMSQSDAYRSSYDVSVDTLDASVWEQASRIANDLNVSSRVKELKDEIAAKALWTREDSVRTLKTVIEGNDKGSEITGAVKVLNEMHGYNAPQKIEHTGGIVHKIELVALASRKD
jgi:hypothetical protein